MNYANNAYSVLDGSISSGATALAVAAGTGSRFPASNFLATLIGYDANGNENAWEIVLCTSRSGDVLNVTRAQEGTTAIAWANATRIENRVTAGTMAGFEPSISAGTTSQYLRGDKTWRDFFTDVRAATLTGLSTATNALITATDTVLAALGKLQAQITGHASNTSNPHSVTKAQVGLGNVDNTSDANKPISTATQAALDAKVNRSGDAMTGALNEAAAVSLASGATTSIGTAESNTVTITGSTTITSFGTAAAGVIRRLVFSGSLTLTHNATSLILPSAAHISTAAGDVATFISLGSGNWRCTSYQFASGVAYKNVPQASKSADYTFALADSGWHLLHPSSDTSGRTFTIPANSSVAFPIGTVLTVVNQNGAGNVSIAISGDTMRLAGVGTTGTRTLAPNGMASMMKITATEWIISGSGLT